MTTVASDVRWHRIFAVAAIVHAALILATLVPVAASSSSFWLVLWVGLTTLWFFWPIILTLHVGASARRAYISLSLSALLLLLPIRSFYLERLGPHVLAGQFGPFIFSPYELGAYSTAYLRGWVQSFHERGAETITLEGFGLGGDATPGVPPLSRDAERRYNVRVEPIAGCGVSASILGHAAGYNAVSVRVLKRRYGADVIALLEREWAAEQER